MSKKSETIEIRISPELKSDLARMSQGRGASMSETVRALIEGEIAGRVPPRPDPRDGALALERGASLLRVAAFALPVLALAVVYLVSAQSPATASAEIRVFFAELDRDGDDRITLPEVEAFAQADGWVPEPDCATYGEPCSLDAYAAAQLQRADIDGSGAVSFAEFEGVMLRDRAEDFLDADLDANGVLSVDELVAAELRWIVDEPEWLAEEGLTLSAACRAQVEAEILDGIAATCGLEALGRAELAVFDADWSGGVSLLEYLAQ